MFQVDGFNCAMQRGALRLAALIVAATLSACGGGGTASSVTGASLPSAVQWQGAAPTFAGEPALDVDQQTLDDHLLCTGFAHADKPPVLLVHGTFTTGPEQYDWNYVPQLARLGYDICVVTYPDRGLGDQQISAEYVVNAVHRIYQRTGRKIAMIGHSQGATMPRWAIKWWPSLQTEIADFVMEAGPNHGTSILGVVPTNVSPVEPAAFYQFAPGSNFVAALNQGNEAPGDIAYTSIYSITDELVEPSSPVPTAALDWDPGNAPGNANAANVVNINLQSPNVCGIGHLVDHVTIGTTDPVAFALAVDAISHAGPADFQRAGGTTLCTLLPLPDLSSLLQPETGLAALLGILQGELSYGIPGNLDLVVGEPPLATYAQ